MVAQALEEELTGLEKLYIILALSKRRVHGYSLLKEIESLTGRKPSPAKIYGFLAKLKDLGITESVGSGSRGKVYYSLTSRGKEEIRRIVDRASRLVEILVGNLLTACINCGCLLYESGYSLNIGGNKILFCCKHCAESYLKSKQ